MSNTANSTNSILDSKILELLASGKSPKQIASILRVPEEEISQRGYDLVKAQTNTNTEQRRALNIYRYEKLIETLWERVMRSGDTKDIRAIRELLDNQNELQGLYQKDNEALLKRISDFHTSVYLRTIDHILTSLKSKFPTLLDDNGWNELAIDTLSEAKAILAPQPNDTDEVIVES